MASASRAARRRRLDLADVALTLVALAVIAFLLFPLLVVIPVSFSPRTVLEFPPDQLSTRWYSDFFSDDRWMDSLFLSLRVGAAAAVLATIIGLACAVALTRYMRRGKMLLRALVLAPLIVPVIVSAIALFDVTITFNLVSTYWGLVLAHTILALPFPVIILESALKSVDRSLEDAAVSLGATRLRAFRSVTVPAITSSLFAAALFAFITSWDEVVIVLFVGGAFQQTLPVLMFEYLTTQVRPTVAAASGVLIAGLVLGAIVVSAVGWYRRRRFAGAPVGEPVPAKDAATVGR